MHYCYSGDIPGALAGVFYGLLEELFWMSFVLIRCGLLCVLGYPSGLVLAVVGTHWSLLAAMLGYSIFIATVFLYMN